MNARAAKPILIKEHVRPQVSTLVHREGFEKLDAQGKLFLMSMFASNAFMQFCKNNVAAKQEDIMNLSPRADWTNEEYAQLSNDMRLSWRFWKDLLAYAEEFEKKNREQESGE